MKTAEQLRNDVEQELRWEPSVHAEQIGISIKNGVVELDGHVGSLYENGLLNALHSVSPTLRQSHVRLPSIFPLSVGGPTKILPAQPPINSPGTFWSPIPSR